MTQHATVENLIIGRERAAEELAQYFLAQTMIHPELVEGMLVEPNFPFKRTDFLSIVDQLGILLPEPPPEGLIGV